MMGEDKWEETLALHYVAKQGFFTISSETNEPENSATTGLHRCELQRETRGWRSGDITPTVGVGIVTSNELRGCKMRSLGV